LDLPLIIQDSYKTPDNIRRYWLDKVFARSGLVFYCKYLGIVLSARKLAVREEYDDPAWAKSSLEIFRLVEKCGGHINISGIENLKKCKGPVVFVSNHMGTMETMIFPFLIVPFMRITFVVKESLVTNKIFGPIMRSRDPITVGRTNSREDLIKVLQEGRKIIENGTSVVIFPQSTRHQEFNPEKFNSLGLKLAIKSGVQIVPVAVKTDFWGNGKKIKELGPINRELPVFIDFGAPIDVEKAGKEAHTMTIDHIAGNLNKWR
jgi:1-acyl-sn-glycerol-3-phosphate acyltransferase